MDRRWIQVRLRRETLAKLREFGERMIKLRTEGRAVDIDSDTEQPGVDVLVCILLARDAAAQKRNSRHARKRLKGGSTVTTFDQVIDEEGDIQ